MGIFIKELESNDNINEIVANIVDIHMNTFEGFFLTSLGKGFLKELYKGFIYHDSSNILIAVDENEKVLGFLAYSENLSDFYKCLIKKRIIAFAFYAFIAFIKKPTRMFRLFRALSYSKKSARTEKYVEISSVGVEKNQKSKGIGSKLIKELISNVDFNNFEYIKLETDGYNNDLANHFYLKNGFVLENSYTTPEGRKMNEYRFYGEKNIEKSCNN